MRNYDEGVISSNLYTVDELNGENPHCGGWRSFPPYFEQAVSPIEKVRTPLVCPKIREKTLQDINSLHNYHTTSVST